MEETIYSVLERVEKQITLELKNRDEELFWCKSKFNKRIFFHVRSKYGKKFDSNVRKIKRKRRKESFNSGKVAEDCVSMPSCDHHISGVCSSW